MHSKLLHLLLISLLLLTGCSFFSAKTAYKPPEFSPMDLSPWRVIDRAEPGTPGGTLRLAEFGSGPKSFNPITANETSSTDITGEIFSSLLDYNFKTNKIVDGLAYQWDHSKDGKVWTVKLRKGLRWSDGEPLTADDVVFTLKAIYDPKVDNPARDIAQVNGKPIQCKKIDETTVQFTIPGVYGPFIYLLSSMTVIPKHKFEKALDSGTFSTAYGVNTPPSEVVGCGPFRIVDYVPQQKVVLERNPYFYAKDVKGTRLPYLDRIVLTYVPDRNTEYLKFRSGEVDAFCEFPTKYYEDLKTGEQAGNYHVVDLGQAAQTAFVVFNQNPNPKFLDKIKYGWFSNRLFRQAVSYAIDRQTMIRLAHLGRGYAVSQDFHPTSPFYDPKIKPYPYDPEKAKKLLSQAGFTWKGGKLYDHGGHPVQFTLLTNSGNAERRIRGELFKENLAKIGMEVDFHPIDFNELVAKLDHEFNWDAIEIGFVDGASLEPSGAQNVWLSSGFSHEWNPRQKKPATPWEAEIDRLVNQGTTTLAREARKKIYGRIEEILYQEELPMILTTVGDSQYAFRNIIGNADPTPLGRFWSASPDSMLTSQVYLKPSTK